MRTQCDLPPPPIELLDGAALFLDLDGTLYDIRLRPELVGYDTATSALLARLNGALGGRLAIVSGRPIADIVRIVGEVPYLLAGSHGLEIRCADGRVRHQPIPEGLAWAVTKLEALASAHDGLIVERKPLSVAVHYRLAPDLESLVRGAAETIAAEAGLRLQPGKMVVELRPCGADKGTAIAALMREPGMAGARPVFMGDDDTDEVGFAVVRKSHGAGILVGQLRSTEAAYRLESVSDAHRWLEAAASYLP